jgi:hypothetical protein
LVLVVAVAQTLEGLTESLLKVGSKPRRSSLGRVALCSASALQAPSTTITASAAQVLADAFVRQPPSEAVMSNGCTWTALAWDRRSEVATPQLIIIGILRSAHDAGR